jgi:tripartite-type tricarboxylate transporter receptor subunit TctC
MTVTRKEFLRASGAFALVVPLGGIRGAYAQAYPSQDIRFVCAFPAGSGADVLVRYFAEKVRSIVNRTIIVENKAGAGGNIALEYVARAKPDGYMIFVHAGSGIAAGMHLMKNPPVDVAKQIQIAATINRQPYMLVVDVKKPWKTLGELTAAMKEKGEKATYGTSNPSATIMGEIYKNVTGVRAIEVNYKTGNEMLNDLASGALDYATGDPVFALAQQREGRIRILAVSTGQRLQAIPDLPTMTELGIPMDVTGWWAAMVPMGTPRPIVDQINKWFVQVVSADDTKKFLNSFGGDPLVSTSEEGQARLVRDVKDWGEFVRLAKIQPQG